MPRLSPDTLFARLVLTFTLGFFVTAVATFLLQLPERAAFVFRITAGQPAHRVADLIKLIDRLPPGSREKMTEVAAAAGVRVSLGPTTLEAAPPDAGTYAATFRDLIAEDLGRGRGPPVRRRLPRRR